MTKVINLAKWCKESMEKEADAPKEEKDTPKEEFSFEEIARRNKENEERLKRERLKANKGVVRSHRLKR